MDKIFKRYGKEKLEEAAKNSNSFIEVVQFLGLNTKNENDRISVMRSIKNNGISYDHFKINSRIKIFNKDELSVLIEKYNNYSEILKELNLPIYYNEKLRNFLYRNKMSFSSKRKSQISIFDDKEKLIELINKSKTQKEVLDKIGLRASGRNYHTLRTYLKLYDLDTSHFTKMYENMVKISKSNKIPLENILIENSTYCRNHLKNRLYETGLKERKCELCDQGEEWNGRHMSLILDHKNGIPDDNRLNNLRIVCPNCNATLDTHCGKNKKIKVEKVKPKTTKSLSKLDVSISRRKVERPSFDVLKTEINALGFEATGRKYNVSGNAIKKWLRTYEKYGV